jgi:hypothetical protein
MLIRVGYLLILFPTLLTLTILASYAVSLAEIKAGNFFISLAFQKDPGRAIATFGLSLSGGAAYALFLAKALSIEEAGLSRWAHRLALFCPIGFLGVAAVTQEYNLGVHSILAMVLFATEGSALTLFLIDDYQKRSANSNKVLFLRLLLLLVCVVSVPLFIYGQVYNLVIACSIELVVTASFITWLLTYSKELSSYSLRIRLIKT